MHSVNPSVLNHLSEQEEHVFCLISMEPAKLEPSFLLLGILVEG